MKILSIDGGGMRGLYCLSLLHNLIQRFNDNKAENFDLGKKFDLICGTSTGAIIACGLACKVPIEKMKELYIEHGKEIFSNPKPDSTLKTICWIVKHLFKNTSNQAKLKKFLEEIFNEMTIKDVFTDRKINLCIPAIDAQKQKGWVFKTPHNKGKNRDDNYKLVDVCLASSAAPIYFPVHEQTDPNNKTLQQFFVDGGLWANNPIIIALLEALTLMKDKKEKIEIVSLGTSSPPNSNLSDISNKGFWGWKGGINIVEMSLASQSFVYQHIAQLFTVALEKFGFNIEIYRIEGTQKSSQEFNAIALDKTDNKATQTLQSMGKADAETIHSKVYKNLRNKKSILIKNIFSK